MSGINLINQTRWNENKRNPGRVKEEEEGTGSVESDDDLLSYFIRLLISFDLFPLLDKDDDCLLRELSSDFLARLIYPRAD